MGARYKRAQDDLAIFLKSGSCFSSNSAELRNVHPFSRTSLDLWLLAFASLSISDIVEILN